jgi:hypothetical protein
MSAKAAGIYKGRKRVLALERAAELRGRIKAGEKKAAVCVFPCLLSRRCSCLRRVRSSN